MVPKIPPNPRLLQLRLLHAEHGGDACDAINELGRLVEAGDSRAIAVLSQYASTGAIAHMRTFAVSTLAQGISALMPELASVFEALSHDSLTRYWAIEGLVRCQGSLAYPRLLAIALDVGTPLADRAKAVKQLSLASANCFDRALPSDPGHWRETDLRLDELNTWAGAGYPRGPGYPVVARHPALDHPATPFEATVAQLESQLAKMRRKEDPANPWFRLVPAVPKDLQAITTQWQLPQIYMDFLTRFSPMRVVLGDDAMCLYGASELIERQSGYAWDQSGFALSGWPAQFVVIGDRGADPFVLDLSRITGCDAPVLSAIHGMGEWDFQEEATTFHAFLKSLL